MSLSRLEKAGKLEGSGGSSLAVQFWLRWKIWVLWWGRIATRWHAPPSDVAHSAVRHWRWTEPSPALAFVPWKARMNSRKTREAATPFKKDFSGWQTGWRKLLRTTAVWLSWRVWSHPSCVLVNGRVNSRERITSKLILTLYSFVLVSFSYNPAETGKWMSSEYVLHSTLQHSTRNFWLAWSHCTVCAKWRQRSWSTSW